MGAVTTPRFLLDSNIVIGLAKGPGAARALVDRRSAPPESCAISVITRIELFSTHLLTPTEEARINALLVTVKVYRLDEAIEQAIIALRRRSRLKLPDAIIGATALMHGLELLTFDDRLTAALATR